MAKKSVTRGTGGGGLPGPGEIPNPEMPPRYIEGPGGGPAMPPMGAGSSREEKANYDEAAEDVDNAAEGMLAVAAAAWLATNFPASVVLGAGALILTGSAIVLDALGDDPPQPFKKIVTFRRRVCQPPGMSDPVHAKLGLVTQRAVFSMVTAQGLLDALERTAGAQKAGDLDWALTHYGVAIQAHQALVRDLAELAAAMNAAATAVSGKDIDLALSPGAGGARKWIR